MKPKTFEVGKAYELVSDSSYFSIDLQRRVKFDDGKKLVIKVSHLIHDEPGGIGYLVDVGGGPFQADYVTKNEIEFEPQDVIGEYELQGGKLYYFEW